MKCTAYSRAERSSPADGVSSCKQSPRLSLSSAAPLKNTTNSSCFFNAFLTHLRDLFQKSHVEPVVCARCLFLQAIPHLRLPSEISRQTSRRYGVPFFVCVPHTVAKTLQAGSSATFEASSCQQFQPLHLPSSAQWFFIIGDCRRRYCLFWFFQLEDIVDFPLIHRPYGFIV